MPSEVFAGISAFKAMMDIAKSIKDMDSAASRNAAVIELQEKIFAAQAVQSELFERVRNLEEQVTQYEAWETEKQRYELYDHGDGKLTYSLKEGVSPPEPPHEICANCYQKNKKSLLQKETWNPGRCRMLVCHSCGSAIYLTGHPSSHHVGYRQRG